MTRLFIHVILFVSALLVPLAGYCAETLKVRPVATITGDDKEKPILLKFPAGVSCNDKSDVVVADSDNGRLLRYTFQENVVKGGAEIKVSQLAYPIRVQMDSKGDIYALDGKLHRIVHLNPQGAFAGYFEPQGMPAPTAIIARNIKIDSGDNIYLLDVFGERVVMSDSAGKYITQVPFPKPYGFFSDLAVNPNGDILLLDSLNAAIFVAKKNTATFVPFVANLKEYLNFAANITTDYRGVVYLTDQNGGSIVAFGQDGSLLGRQLTLGWKNGQLYYPSQLCVTKAGTIFIADRGNSRVQVFELLK